MGQQIKIIKTEAIQLRAPGCVKCPHNIEIDVSFGRNASETIHTASVKVNCRASNDARFNKPVKVNSYSSCSRYIRYHKKQRQKQRGSPA
jgi:hypothetical protein